MHHLKKTLLNDSMTHFCSQHNPKVLPIKRETFENSMILLHNFGEMNCSIKICSGQKNCLASF